MNQFARIVAQGMSKGMFLAAFLIPCALTYPLGLFKFLLPILYVPMAVACFLRGTANGTKWAVVLPLTAGVFDVLLAFVPFVPTVLNVVALVVGIRNGRGAASTAG